MKRNHMYLILCVLGFALPYSQFIPWVIANRMNVKYFVQQLFANRISAFFGFDVLVSANPVVRFHRR